MMLSMLFVFGLLLGIGVAAMAVASVVSAACTVLAWLNVFVVILYSRSGMDIVRARGIDDGFSRRSSRRM